VVGLLIRHATVIDPEVSQVGIVEGMVEILNSKETAQVRRKACAALGEYLFYGATQMDEDPTNQYWDVTTLSFTTLLKLIKNSSEDLTG
jgi:serine/threonine-protein kinase ULK4